MTGTSSAGISIFTVLKVMSVHTVPAVVWIALVLAAATVLLSALGLILEYKLRKLDVETLRDLKKTRLETHRAVMEKAAGEPESAQNYRHLILADALYVSVEQNGVQLADKTHEHLYGTNPTANDPTGCLPR